MLFLVDSSICPVDNECRSILRARSTRQLIGFRALITYNNQSWPKHLLSLFNYRSRFNCKLDNLCLPTPRLGCFSLMFTTRSTRQLTAKLLYHEMLENKNIEGLLWLADYGCYGDLRSKAKVNKIKAQVPQAHKWESLDRCCVTLWNIITVCTEIVI